MKRSIATSATVILAAWIGGPTASLGSDQIVAPGSSIEGARSLSAQSTLSAPTSQTPQTAPVVPFNQQAPLGTSGPAPSPSLPTIASGSAPVEVTTPLVLPSETAPDSGRLDHLPGASGAPLAIDFSRDPVLRFGHQSASSDLFRDLIGRAVTNHPGVREAQAQVTGARAVVRQAAAGLYPTLDLSVTADHSLSRNFGNDEDAILERIRPRGRTDAEGVLTQTVLDFGATARRIKASRARVEGANADVESTAEQVAMHAISAWYDLAAYRALVAMGEALAADQAAVRDAIRTRVAQGLSSDADVARTETYTTNADARLAGFRRSLMEAEARYTEAVGLPAPAIIDRPVLPAALPASIDDARMQAHHASEVRSAEAAAKAAQEDYGSATASLLPKVQAVVDAGRYGVLEDPNDYDVRGRLVLTHRLFGGGAKAQADQAEARYIQARAAADRTADEAERDAAIGFTDLKADETEVAALEQAYVANRKARDAIAERFRVTQGNLLDVLSAEDNYFQVAASYIQAVTRADAERLVLLQREGRLLSSLGVTLPDHVK